MVSSRISTTGGWDSDTNGDGKHRHPGVPQQAPYSFSTHRTNRPLPSVTPGSKRRQARVMRAHRRRDLMTRSQRAVRWLQPGLVVKRWMLTSGLGLLMAVIGAAVWADLKPIYWILETLSWLLGTITTVLPREFTGPLVLIIGAALVLWGQSRSFGCQHGARNVEGTGDGVEPATITTGLRVTPGERHTYQALIVQRAL